MEDNKEVVISLKNVSKTFRIYDRKSETIRDRVLNILKRNKKREIKAVDDVSLEIYKGEFFGIIGSNGSGKSTLIHLMTGSLLPDKGGESTLNGTYMRMSLGMGFNGELSAMQNILVNSTVLGIRKKKIEEITPQIFRFSGLGNFKNTKVKYFSKGMKVRLSFAIAVHAKADVFLMDEFFGGVGDVSFKKKANKVFTETMLTGRTIIHVSHNLSTIKKYCNRVLLMNKGEMVMVGTPSEVIPVYKELMQEDD